MAKKRSTTRRRSTQKVSLKNLNAKSVGKSMISTGSVLVGMFLGHHVVVQLDKLINKPTGGTAGIGAVIEGIFGVDGKALAAPAITALVGAGAATLLKHPEFKLLSTGASAAGVYHVAKKGFGKDLLAGLPVSIPGIGNANLPELQAATKAAQVIDLSSGPASEYSEEIEGTDDMPELI